MITTDHTDFDYDMMVRNSRVVIDTRNATTKMSAAISRVVLLRRRESKRLVAPGHTRTPGYGQ